MPSSARASNGTRVNARMNVKRRRRGRRCGFGMWDSGRGDHDFDTSLLPVTAICLQGRGGLRLSGGGSCAEDERGASASRRNAPEIERAEAVGLVEIGLAADQGPASPVGILAAIGAFEKISSPPLAGEGAEAADVVF